MEGKTKIAVACALACSALYYIYRVRRRTTKQPNEDTKTSAHPTDRTSVHPTEESSLFDLEEHDNYATSYAIPMHRHKTASFQESNLLRSPPTQRDQLQIFEFMQKKIQEGQAKEQQ